MKHLSVVFFMLLIISGSSFGQEKDFRNITWGMNRTEVKSSEKSEPIYEPENEDYVVYQVKIANLECNVYYTFVSDKLTSGAYFLTEEHTNKNLYIDDFKSLKSLLTKKYGEPSDYNTIWSDDLYKDDSDSWGFAISLGHMKMYSLWETPKTKIDCVLKGDNYKISLYILYRSKEHLDLINSKEESESLDGL